MDALRLPAYRTGGRWLRRLPWPVPVGGAAAAEVVGCLHDLEALATDALDISRWARVDVPVLPIQGGDTWAPVPATVDALAEALPAVTRAVLPGQSHFATHTAPALFAETLRRFLHEHG